MKSRLALAVLLVCIVSCQEVPSDFVSPVEREQVLADLAKGEPPEGFVLLEPGFTAELVASGLNTPEGLDRLGNGILYVVESQVGRILRVLPSGKAFQIGQVPFTEPTEGLIDLVVDPPRGMFVTLIRADKIVKVTFTGQVTDFASTLDRPLFMAFDAQKILYVSEFGGASISRFDQEGNPTKIVELDNATRPRGIVFDKEGRLYVASDFAGEIRRFDVSAASSFPMPLSNGVFIANIRDQGFPVPVNPDITFGFDGDLFAVARNEIYRIKLDGTVTVFATGLRGPFNAIITSTTGNLIVSDFALGSSPTGRIIKISIEK